MPTTRPTPSTVSLALCLALFAPACADDAPAVCALDAPVRVLASTGPIVIDWVTHSNGSDLVRVLNSPGAQPDSAQFDSVFSIQPCEETATNLRAEAFDLSPLTSELPRGASSDSAFACAGSRGQFVRLDLSGETAPTPAFAGLLCDVSTTPRGTLTWIGEDREKAELWLLPQFPERTGGKRILASAGYLIDETPKESDLVPYAPYDSESQSLVPDLHIIDLATGVDTLVAKDVATLDGAGGRWIWTYEGPDATMNLYDHARGESIALAPYSPTIDEPTMYDETIWQGWLFNKPRTHVLHLPWSTGATMEAFDLAGMPVALPLTRRPFALTDDGGVLASGDAPGEVLYARPGDAAPRRLSYPPDVPNNIGLPKGDIIELRLDGQLWEVPLSGEPFRLIARGVGMDFVRLDDRHLVTIYQHTLTTIHLPSGVRVEHASDVGDMRASSDGGFYYTVNPDYTGRDLKRTGLWYLSPETVVRPPKNCPLVSCPRD